LLSPGSSAHDNREMRVELPYFRYLFAYGQ